jgi:hypothetical protein
MISYGFWDAYPNQRMYGTARPTGQPILVDNPVW